MKRNATHGRSLFQATVFSGKCNLQFLGCSQCILKEHFIKIAQTVKKDTVAVFFFGLYVFFHHW